MFHVWRIVVVWKILTVDAHSIPFVVSALVFWVVIARQYFDIPALVKYLDRESFFGNTDAHCADT
jgi:hypothetical protein